MFKSYLHFAENWKMDFPTSLSFGYARLQTQPLAAQLNCQVLQPLLELRQNVLNEICRILCFKPRLKVYEFHYFKCGLFVNFSQSTSIGYTGF